MSIFGLYPAQCARKKKAKRARMKKGIKSEVGLYCLKFGKTSHREKVCLKGICQKAVISAVIWVRSANKSNRGRITEGSLKGLTKAHHGSICLKSGKLLRR